MSSGSDKNIHGRKPIVNHFILTDPRSFPLLFMATNSPLRTPNSVTTPLSTGDISRRPETHNKENKWPCLAYIFSPVWQLPTMTAFLKIVRVYVEVARASFLKEMTLSASSNFPNVTSHLFFLSKPLRCIFKLAYFCFILNHVFPQKFDWHVSEKEHFYYQILAHLRRKT